VSGGNYAAYLRDTTLEVVSKPHRHFFWCYHDTCHLDESDEHADIILVSHNKPSEVSEPTERALNDISSLVAIPESIILSIDVPMIVPVRPQETYASTSQPLPGRVAVIRFVADHSLGSGPGSSGPSAGDSDGCQGLLKERDLSRRGRVRMASQKEFQAYRPRRCKRSSTFPTSGK
jgi:hypothetical protein